jgi:hypoxanthine phosphoribosyltransferase
MVSVKKLSWADIEILCDRIVRNLKDEYEIIVPIARGGLCPASIIANMLGVSNVQSLLWQTRDNQLRDRDTLQKIINCHSNILFVDDMIDSGQCLYEIGETIMNEKRDLKLTCAVLLENVSCQYNVHNFCVVVSGQKYDKNLDNRWVVFPWEKNGHD